MTEHNSRAQAWQARKHQTTIRRSRKGGDNSRVNRRGLPPVIGSDVTTATWDDLVPADVSDALRADVAGSHRLLLGLSGLDLARIVDRYADVLDVPTMLGGEAIAYAQTFDVDNASPGADVFDLISLCNNRDSLTGWADSPGAAQAFRNPSDHESKLSWPARMTAGVARFRTSESDQCGPRIPRSDGKLRRTGRLYGAEFVRTGRRAVVLSRATIGNPRHTFTGPCLYGTPDAWEAISTRWSVRDHAGAPIVSARLTWADSPNYDRRARVFIGHRSVVRGPVQPTDIKAPKHLGAFKLTNAEQVRHLLADLMVPDSCATVDFGPFEPGLDTTFGTFSRAESGRFSLSLFIPGGKVRHQPKGVAAAVEYASRYLS